MMVDGRVRGKRKENGALIGLGFSTGSQQERAVFEKD